MDKDTYKGESLGKKIARAWFWILAREYLGSSFYTGKHLVLASREGGDAAVLKAMGVSTSNIHAAEINQEAASAFAKQHPDVSLYIGDVNKLVKKRNLSNAFVCAHLDFCGNMSEKLLDMSMSAARFAIRDCGILSIGFSKGRESGDTFEAIKTGIEYVLEGSKFASADDRAFYTRLNSTGKRSTILEKTLRHGLTASGPPVDIDGMCTIGYSSGRTPMIYQINCVFKAPTKKLASSYARLFGKRLIESEVDSRGDVIDFCGFDQLYHSADAFMYMHGFTTVNGRRCTKYPTEFGVASPAMVVMMADVCDAYNLPAARMLNVRQGRLAAWRAHRTMGTYDKAA